MPLSYKARRRWALVILLVGLPVYVVVAITVVSLFDRPPFAIELLVYVGLGVVWVLPLRRVFLGVARDDADAGGRH